MTVSVTRIVIDVVTIPMGVYVVVNEYREATMGYGWHDHAMGGGWWILMVLGMLVFLAVFVTGAVLLAQHYGRARPDGGTPTASPATDTPTEILQTRLARGEIDAEEYTRLLAVLEGKP
jgi:putative membrane protein